MKCTQMVARFFGIEWEITINDLQGERIIPKKGYEGPYILTPTEVTLFYQCPLTDEKKTYNQYKEIMVKHLLEMSYKKIQQLEDQKDRIVEAIKRLNQLMIEGKSNASQT